MSHVPVYIHVHNTILVNSEKGFLLNMCETGTECGKLGGHTAILREPYTNAYITFTALQCSYAEKMKMACMCKRHAVDLCIHVLFEEQDVLIESDAIVPEGLRREVVSHRSQQMLVKEGLQILRTTVPPGCTFEYMGMVVGETPGSYIERFAVCECENKK